MHEEIPVIELLQNAREYFLPAVSVDNVIFGFHEDELRVLLLHMNASRKWALPGGYVFKDEEIDDAATRILKRRTGLQNLFLQQFHTFGSTGRTRTEVLKEFFSELNPELLEIDWFMQRFITVGYYALVEYGKVIPQPDEFSDRCTWHELNKLPKLIFDHGHIIDEALQAMRLQLSYQPIGYNLLPKEFPLKSLQVIYEATLGRKLDRGNFNRKILSAAILEKKDKLYSGGAHKAPYLYSFNKKKYFAALKNGLKLGF